jgi:hypothetical protein
MSAEAIDLDMLNKLFDNQKNLDNVFSSIFDDEPVISTTSLPSDELIFDGGSWDDDKGFNFNNSASFNTDEAYSQKKNNLPIAIISVVLEIVAIYLGISYFL